MSTATLENSIEQTYERYEAPVIDKFGNPNYGTLNPQIERALGTNGPLKDIYAQKDDKGRIAMKRNLATHIAEAYKEMAEKQQPVSEAQEGLVAKATQYLDNGATLAGLALTAAAAATGVGAVYLLGMAGAKILTATARYAAARYEGREVSGWGIGRSLANIVVPPVGYVADVAVGAYDIAKETAQKAFGIAANVREYNTEKAVKLGIERYLKATTNTPTSDELQKQFDLGDPVVTTPEYPKPKIPELKKR